MIRHRIAAPLIAWVNRVAGLVIVIFGAAAILRGLR